jgi:hypothetical protein
VPNLVRWSPLDPNSLNAVAAIIWPLSIVAVIVLGRRATLRKRIVITDFRRGVRFVGGVFSGVLDAGSYTFNPRKEQITIVDMRPQPILIERLGFQDALSHQGVISVGTDLLVRDPQLAANALRDQVKDAYILARDVVRTAMSKQIIPDNSDVAGLTQTLNAAIRVELGKVGMDISDIEITELWSSPPSAQPHTRSVSTVVQ